MPTLCLVALSLLSDLTILTVQTSTFNYSQCFEGNYTNPSTYKTNLNILLSDLTSNAQIDYGFYNMSYGQDPDRVSAIGLCRGDVKPNICRSCLSDATNLLLKTCPNQKEAMGGYDECILRYSNRSIFGVMESADDFWLYSWTGINATEPEKFNQVVRKLLEELSGRAAAGDSLRKYAAGNESGPNFQTVFGAVQCTPDLSERNCSNCLVKAISKIPENCSTWRGCRILTPSCNIRYEDHQFFDLVAEDSPPPSLPLPLPPATSTSRGNNTKPTTIIAIVVPIVAVILLLISVFIFVLKRKPKDAIQSDELDGEIKPTDWVQLDFNTIRIATDNFSDANKLGQGGFGPVYKGKLYNGEEIAVKRLSRNSGQGDIEFKNEVMLVAKLQHRNLVRLLGFCLEREERLLIYEFLPNKSLDYLLFNPNQRTKLNWEIRYKIIMGVARGLLYLHEDSRLRVIHRDLKVSNILLDEEMNPKISDFGMARLFVVDQTQSNTSRIVGTYGYIASEYALHGQFSIKSDVFSFGVLVLEIISGKKNNSIFHEENDLDLLGFAWKNCREWTSSNIVDPALNNGSRNEILRCIHIALLCVQENVADRPTMALVAVMLSSDSMSLPLPLKPPYLINSGSSSKIHVKEDSLEATRSSEGGDNYVQTSRNEDSITELYPR